jgi:nucleoporin NUP82
VRIWELSITNRWSFDTPQLAIDLKRLADGTSLDQDFSASASATNIAFSPDTFEMEVASACFGSRSSGGWNSFTLWLAMREGDIYCLCPLLPSRWAPPRALIGSLSVSIVANVAAIEDDPSVSEQEKLLAQQQLAWMGEIDSQEPQILETPLGELPIEVYTRPEKPGKVPRLQGPFVLDAYSNENENDIDAELTDILAIGSKVEADELMGDDPDYELEDTDTEGLSLTLVCLLSTSGQVKICIDLQGIEAQWLPPKNKSKLARMLAESDPPSLLLYSAMDSMSALESHADAWPVFSTDVTSKYTFYVTHHAGITYFSLSSWVFRLESEIADSSAGSEFRLGLLVNSHNSLRERLYTQPQADVTVPLAACNAINDPDIGYGVISATPFDPVVLIFETQEDDYPLIKRESPSPTPFDEREQSQPLYTYAPRPPFQVSHVFDQDSDLPKLLERLRSSKHRVAIGQEIRLSPLTLQILTEAHKILSEETHHLGLAVSDLFVKSHTMRDEMQDQLLKAAETSAKIDKIVGADGEGSDNARIEARIRRAQDRQRDLARRLEGLRKAVGRAGKRELSQKEMAWIAEVKGLETSVLAPSTADNKSAAAVAAILKKRLDKATNLSAELVTEAKQLIKEADENDGVAGEPLKGASPGKGHGRTSSQDLRVPNEIRKAKLAHVKALLAREEAMVQAVSSRLEKLQVGAP